MIKQLQSKIPRAGAAAHSPKRIQMVMVHQTAPMVAPRTGTNEVPDCVAAVCPMQVGSRKHRAKT